jgi:hypothetical protein
MKIKMKAEMMKKVKNLENNNIIKIRNQRRKTKKKKIKKKDNQVKLQKQKVTVN